jgi:1,4-dihydroxy-6-naphthoate synthase
VVAREAGSLEEARAGRIAIPGRETTAFLLLRLAAPALGDVVELRYDRILDAVVCGEVDAGLIIHESRFTYGEHGLVAVADLGEWWEGETGLPSRWPGSSRASDLEPELVDAAEAAIRASVEYAFAHPEASRDYVRSLSQGDVRRGLRGAHRALRERAQRRHRRRGARRDRPAARSRRQPLP